MKPERNAVIDALFNQQHDQHETVLWEGKVRPKLTEQERNDLFKKWRQKRLAQQDLGLLNADCERALRKSGETAEEAKQHSATATVKAIFAFHRDLASYAIDSRSHRQSGGFNSGGKVENTERPTRERVIAAIRRELGNKTPHREIPARVRAGGINLSTKQIRTIGQQLELLPKRKR